MLFMITQYWVVFLYNYMVLIKVRLRNRAFFCSPTGILTEYSWNIENCNISQEISTNFFKIANVITKISINLKTRKKNA